MVEGLGFKVLGACFRLHSCIQKHSSSAILFLFPNISIFLDFSIFCFFLFLLFAMGYNMTTMAWRAGATTTKCSLCLAGTYQTGSGETVL